MGSDPGVWWWAGFGALLVVAEILSLRLFMLPFGIGAAAAAVGAWLGLGSLGQAVAFVTVSAACLAALRWYARRHVAAPTAAVAGDRLVNGTGVVIESIDPVSGSGRARVNREEWRAESSDSQTIPAGTRVLVRRVEGAHLVVHAEEER